ncbi:MAG TPA: enoyl-CoA hydratase/isomerase family protein [Acidimicrobiia bacterium]|nr:enoyl-CoA hydratase/isomerase family protein [Acidimicrobiia bacterium]
MSDVDIERDGGVATLVMRSGAHNTVRGTLLADVLEAVEELERDDGVRVVITAAEGPIWCASADFEDLDRHLGRPADDLLHDDAFAGAKGLPLQSAQARRFDRLGIGHWVLRFRRFGKPLVAALTGSVAGGGLSLAVMHDFRIASAEARFRAAFMSMAVGPEMGLSFFLPRLVGLPVATDLLLRDRKLDASEALACGLVHEVVAPADVVPRARALAEELAAKPPLAVRAHIRALRATVENSLAGQLELEWDNQRICLESDDARAAAKAAISRTPTEYFGR